jgi:F-type H+-transporting ATPase subunit delta
MGQEDVIARRYAKGLAERVAETNETPQARRDVRILAGIVDPGAGDFRIPEFAEFLSSPTISQGDKLAAAANIMRAAGIGKTVSDFFSVLITRGRAELMPRIAQAFSVFAGELTGERTAVVRTARPLSADQASRLTEALSTAFGGVVHLHQRVEPGLLAGAKVTVGDSTFDGSVLGRLERMRDMLSTEGVDKLFDGTEKKDAICRKN